MVEIEINSNCNRKCQYCPNSKLKRTNLPLYMDTELFNKILSELKKINFDGRISYHFYGEPLLHPNLGNLIEKTSKMLKKSRLILYTNGDLLTEKKYLELVKSGVDYFVVTSHSLKTFPNRPKQIVLYPNNLHLTNRGGVIGVLIEPFKFPCFAPTTTLIITITGEILLCYEDARREHVFGNIMYQPLEEIWYSNKFIEIRKQLASGNREAVNICKICNNIAHLEPIRYDYVL